MKIGVFDSGRGGELMAENLEKILPEYDYFVANDREHVPYGSRSNEQIKSLTDAALQPLIRNGCEIIIIACNTATMASIEFLRARYPALHFIGIEPMIKPAQALSKTRHITVLATPLTLQSDRYHRLKQQYAGDLIIDEPDASGWARMIEFEDPSSIDFTEVAETIRNGSDTLVLACTHYVALVDRLHAAFPNVTLLEPTHAIARQITRVATGRQARSPMSNDQSAPNAGPKMDGC